MNRLTIAQIIIDKLKAETYLEIGVRHGRIITKLKCRNKIGVDPEFKLSEGKRLKKFFGLLKFKAYHMTSDKFFLEHAKKTLPSGIDVVLIDGFHTYSQLLRDVENCLEYLNEDGIIIMHDCNPLNSASAMPVKESTREVTELAKKGELPGWNDCWHGDVWKTIVHLQIENSDLTVFTLDIDWGLGIVARGKNTSPHAITLNELENADYTFLEKDRANLLNLKPPKYLFEFLDKRFPETV
jgi:hypothetical protein